MKKELSDRIQRQDEKGNTDARACLEGKHAQAYVELFSDYKKGENSESAQTTDKQIQSDKQVQTEEQVQSTNSFNIALASQNDKNIDASKIKFDLNLPELKSSSESDVTNNESTSEIPEAERYSLHENKNNDISTNSQGMTIYNNDKTTQTNIVDEPELVSVIEDVQTTTPTETQTKNVTSTNSNNTYSINFNDENELDIHVPREYILNRDAEITNYFTTFVHINMLTGEEKKNENGEYEYRGIKNTNINTLRSELNTEGNKIAD